MTPSTLISKSLFRIMGPTGSGKSTFINNLVGEDVVAVGQTMESCTIDITPVVVEIPNNPFFNGRRLIVVDTPGFDDTKGNDLEILRRIALWLASSYDAGMKLGGVVYLHDITQPRMVRSTRNNFSVFNKLCGKDAFTSIVLGTTRWSDISPREAQNHLEALSQTVWKDMIKRGSILGQIHGPQDSRRDRQFPESGL
ncbi:uncharacterized protein LACBIDRAFT_251637 [Laccaria bicolor S238N-H82]|uniref:Predicted protein n=1 Tax=Laccaria bicolor (strain S238N-H82 / ATCC MYA-4686) TaxID=486041 RepID=B0DHW8_LACBS|nr:uncharacterized protein LACBIDRAFT_251637 [Laccaria bicolor S238N-H82]EDR05907.1 predicted protein [Laccaria bicolor S238N-H82]|eukprot:XP_001883583.1 predicted protein [Laccaria bicolor S238N-H82]